MINSILTIEIPWKSHRNPMEILWNGAEWRIALPVVSPALHADPAELMASAQTRPKSHGKITMENHTNILDG